MSVQTLEEFAPETGLFQVTDLAATGSPDERTSVPLYLQVARLIERRIRDGSLKIGSLLPTENDLAKMLGVSRQTVRHAIGHLRNQSMLSARKGVGTRVEALQRDWRSRFSVGSVADLVELARETEMRLTMREDIEARGKLAVELACRPTMLRSSWPPLLCSEALYASTMRWMRFCGSPPARSRSECPSAISSSINSWRLLVRSSCCVRASF